jgi:serine/threonine-protein kinase
MAPEIPETGQSDARADIYAVGIMLYELIAGVQPYEGSTPVQIAMKHINEDVPVLSSLYPQVPRAVSLLIEVLCARDRNKRPPDAAKALELLRKLARSLSAAELAVKLPPPPKQSIENEHINLDEPVFDSELPNFEDSVDTPLEPELVPYRDEDNTPTNVLSAAELVTIKRGSGGLNSGFEAVAGADTSAQSTTSVKRGSKKLRVVLISVVSVLTCILIAAVILWYQLVGPGSRVEVPAGIVGTAYNSAKDVLNNSGIHYTEEDVFSDTVPDGVVISTVPKSGEYLSKKVGELKVTVSKGVQYIQIPNNLSGRNINDVIDDIKDAGFKDPKVIRENRIDVDKDIVLAVDPEESSKQKHDVQITITVSDGPRPVIIPNLTNLTEADATQKLAELGVEVTHAEAYSDTVEEGNVISQGTAGGTQVFEGTSVVLTISKGSEFVEVPDVKDLVVQVARDRLASADLKYAEVGSPELGRVQKQDVAPGSKVKRGSVVTITIV